MSSSPSLSPSSRGRPRDPEVDHQIRRAALRLVGEVGYDRMTMDAVAAAAGVAKATVYRRWSGKAELVADAVREYGEPGSPVPVDTGTLRGDLLAMLPSFLVFAEFESGGVGVIAGLAHASRNVPELADFMRHGIVSTIRHHSEIVIERAIARGELAAGARTLPLFHDIAPSILAGRMLMTHEAVDEAFRERLVDELLLPLLIHL